MNRLDYFVRVPTEIMETLLQARLSGGSYRILLWVIRQTYGWNRPSAPFTWYRMAQDVGMSRPALYRAGQKLLSTGFLVMHHGQLAVQIESSGGRQLCFPKLDVTSEQRSSLPESNASVAARQPNRCRKATLFRRAKDRSKDNIKKQCKKDAGVAEPHLRHGALSEQRYLAGAAKPAPGKYDCVSEN